EVKSLEKEAKAGLYKIVIEELRPASRQDKSLVIAQNLFAEAEALRLQGTRESIRSAVEKCSQSLPYWQQASRPSQEALTLNMIGENLNNLGERRKALEYRERALALARQIGDRSEEANALIGIGLIYDFLGEYNKAQEYNEIALPLVRAIGNRADLARVLNNMGKVYNEIEKNQLAIDCYQEALPIARSINNQHFEAAILNGIGVAYSYMEDPKQALNYFNQALAIFKKIDNKASMAGTLANICTAHNSMAETEKALDCFNEALSLQKELGDDRRRAITLSNVGIIYAELGELTKSLDYYFQALQLHETLGSRLNQAITLNKIGDTYYLLGNLEKALEYFNKALTLERTYDYRAMQAITLKHIGTTHLSLADGHKALEYQNQSLLLFQEIGNRFLEAKALMKLGKTHHFLADNQKALACFQQALAVFRTKYNGLEAADALYNIALVKSKEGNIEAALNPLQEAISIGESLRVNFSVPELRNSYSAGIQNYYELYITLLMQLHNRDRAAGYHIQAFQVAERTRARTLVEILEEARINIYQGISQDMLEQERRLRQRLNNKAGLLAKMQLNGEKDIQIDAVRKQIEELNEQVQRLESQIRQDNPHYAAFKYPEPLNLNEIQQQVLDDDTLLLEYALGKERGYLWAVTTNSIDVFELPGRAVIEELALEFYKLITAREDQIKFEKPAQRLKRVRAADAKSVHIAAQLSDLLIRPATKLLGRKRLIIVGDGLLRYIPFAALPAPTGKDNQAHINSRKSVQVPLVVKHEITYLPSASTLVVQRREIGGRASASKLIRIFANPVFSALDSRVKPVLLPDRQKQVAATQTKVDALMGELEPLPETELAAHQILALVPANTSELATGFDANLTSATSPELGQYK
ncbi:MAG: tetratricopeptide repeat protein, partial [Acidobacteriota bacterium]